MTTTNEIVEKIAAENSLTKIQAKAIVDGVFKAIADAAVSGAETSSRVRQVQGQGQGHACARGS
ncbi:nucleoid DNA-binding protein [Bradyrhizobium liaoningense]